MSQNFEFTGINKVDFSGKQAKSLIIMTSHDSITRIEIIGPDEAIKFIITDSKLSLEEIEIPDTGIEISGSGINISSNGIKISDNGINISVSNVGNSISSISTVNGRIVSSFSSTSISNLKSSNQELHIIMKVPKGTALELYGVIKKISIDEVSKNFITNLNDSDLEIKKMIEIERARMELTNCSVKIDSVFAEKLILGLIGTSTVTINQGEITNLRPTCINSDLFTEEKCHIKKTYCVHVSGDSCVTLKKTDSYSVDKIDLDAVVKINNINVKS